MIRLHVLKGSTFFLNADLIESVVAEPVTTVTLFDGRQFRVEESADEVVDLVRRFRASVLREAEDMNRPRAELIILPDAETS